MWRFFEAKKIFNKVLLNFLAKVTRNKCQRTFYFFHQWHRYWRRKQHHMFLLSRCFLWNWQFHVQFAAQLANEEVLFQSLGGQKQDSERDSLFTFSLFLSRRESDVWNEFGTEKWIKVVDKMSLSLFTDRVRLRGFENWHHHFWPPATTLRAGQRPTVNSKANLWNYLISQRA